MIAKPLQVPLPPPWMNQVFTTNQIGSINYLVGPNGTGKSRFARQLVNYLPNSRLLGTDRLSGMEEVRPFVSIMGDPLAEGLAKSRFNYFKQDGIQGYGMDAFVLLEERMDLRIQVEATLSHLFDREIILEWDSGNLIARARRIGDTAAYRLDREECHGIKELLVLLTHLYDMNNRHLIIDEPELNLHPQYQAFFMQEVRKVTGDPHINPDKKIVFLITHSPFMLDLQSEDDLNSIVSFDLQYSVPKQVCSVPLNLLSPNSFVRRLNAHHKQFFFSDNPIFVEGIHDAWLVEAMMAARGVSVSAAGSCVIDSSGAEEVNQYLRLCRGLGKEAHFLYDLDSLFGGTLRSCMRDDESISGFLASSGLGKDFIQYCGALDSLLTQAADKLIASPLAGSLIGLGELLRQFGDRKNWDRADYARARTAIMTAVSRHREGLAEILSREDVEVIEGRWERILTALKQRNIHVLPGGTIERYLPHYSGDDYSMNSDAKRSAIHAEIEEISNLGAYIRECPRRLAVALRRLEVLPLIVALRRRGQDRARHVFRRVGDRFRQRLGRPADRALRHGPLLSVAAILAVNWCL